MSDNSLPYISSCEFCEQGLVRIASCHNCEDLVAICDECEAVWASPQAIADDAGAPTNAQHPDCPHCDRDGTPWRFLTRVDLEQMGLADLTSGPAD